MMTEDPYAWLEKSLATIHRANWYRSPQTIGSRPGPVVEVEGRDLMNFASNDYLGLAGDDRLIEAAMKATQEWGTGATGSRLITGHRTLHRQLEKAIADWKQTEDAIVFSSGYLANLGAIAALVAMIFGASSIPALIFAIQGLLIFISIVAAWAKFGRERLPALTLLAVPLYLLWKIPLYLAFVLKPQTKWIRTERDTVDSPD